MEKQISIKYFFTALIAIILLNACELEEANLNPNDPTEVPVNVLMPFNQSRVAARMCGSTQVMAGIFMQYYEGVDQHPAAVQNYIINEATYVEWQWDDYYTGPMENLHQMIQLAEEDDIYYYSGIGKVLMALCLGNLTSLWGDIPYSEALLGSEIRSPKYDPQSEIYESIHTLLDEAIGEMQTDYEGLKPDSADVIFGGDMAAWIKAAYALKARYYMHVTKRTGDLAYNPAQEALNAVSNAFSSSEDDLEYAFGYSSAEDNPFYSFSLSDYIVPNEYFDNLLTSLDDPRRTDLFAVQFGQLNVGGGFFTKPDSKVPFITYHELKFIEAEARLRLNASDPEIQSALHDAVTASMVKIAEGDTNAQDVADYLAANATLTGNFNTDLETIIIQKYIAMYSTIESWVDYRRTGYPQLTPNTNGDPNNNPGGGIPRRLLYCQTERLYNQNIPQPIPTLQDRFWWDVD